MTEPYSEGVSEHQRGCLLYGDSHLDRFWCHLLERIPFEVGYFAINGICEMK